MRAVLYDRFGGPLRLEQVPDPAPAPDGVVIEVQAAGLCRSDWHGWQGHDPDIVAFPHVPGHELAGVVAAVGRQVQRFRPGDYVTVPFVAGCGGCPECTDGHPQVCDAQFQPGFTAWGAFAEAVAIRYADHNLVALPKSLAATAAAALGCRVGTAYRAVVEVGQVAPGDWVAVHGCGGLGLAAVMIATALQARVVAVDLRPDALDLAAQFGAELTLEATDSDHVVEAIVAHADGRGAQIALDAAGSAASAVNSIRCLRKRGRHVQVGLLAGVDARPSLPMELVVARELQICGSHGIAAASYPKLLEMATSGSIAPGRLIERTISLTETPEAFAAMGKSPCRGITMVDMNLAG